MKVQIKTVFEDDTPMPEWYLKWLEELTSGKKKKRIIPKFSAKG